MRSILGIVVVVACDRKPDAPPPVPPVVAPQPPADAAVVVPDAGSSCDTLDRKQCLGSRECTLHHLTGSEYDCRPAQGACETDLVQGDRAACVARAGCTFEPGSCYCDCVGYGHTRTVREQLGGCACACGGGPPPMCR